MKKPIVLEGRCEACGMVVARSRMTRHLSSCAAVLAGPPGATGPTSLHHVFVEGWYNPEYWLHAEAPAHATLDELDGFLRDIWLECCGHLSAFKIGGELYTSVGSDPVGGLFDSQSMDCAIGDLMTSPVWTYEYDFGSTTKLKIRMGSARSGMAKGVRLLARNLPPKLLCGSCGKVATQICRDCLYDGDGVFCDACLQAHECGDDLALPVVNSPRMGVCGYSG